MKTEMKNCPCCGATAHWVTYDMYTYYIVCDECGIGTPRCESLERALFIWNRRVK